MWINNYPQMIAESAEEQLEREMSLRGSPLESRLKMLRLLKGSQYRSRRSLAEVLGYSQRQLGRSGGKATDMVASRPCWSFTDRPAKNSASPKKLWMPLKNR